MVENRWRIAAATDMPAAANQPRVAGTLGDVCQSFRRGLTPSLASLQGLIRISRESQSICAPWPLPHTAGIMAAIDQRVRAIAPRDRRVPAPLSTCSLPLT